MPPEPVPADPGWDEDPTWLDRDPERQTWLDRAREHDDPPSRRSPVDFPGLTPDELADIEDAAADELLAVEAASHAGGVARASPAPRGCSPASHRARRRRSAPGWSWTCCRAARSWRSPPTPPREYDGFDGVSEAELIGVMCAWDRVEAHAAARKLAAVAELARRNPGPEDAEFTADQVAYALGESRVRADELMGTAGHLDTHLPGTRPRCATAPSAWARPGSSPPPPACSMRPRPAPPRPRCWTGPARLTPGGLRAAIARAVMEAAPEKARKRRETGARFARVERWAEDSGNAALAGRELPPDEVLAADERITARARELKAAGLDGGMDELRARAYLDLLLGKDSRPGQDQPATARPARPPRPRGSPAGSP